MQQTAQARPLNTMEEEEKEEEEKSYKIVEALRHIVKVLRRMLGGNKSVYIKLPRSKRKHKCNTKYFSIRLVPKLIFVSDTLDYS